MVIETMNDLPHPGGSAIDQLGDGGITHVARRKHDDPGVAAIDGIAPLSFQAPKFDLFKGAKGAYSDGVFHDAPPGERCHKHRLEVFYATWGASAARNSTYLA